MNIDTILQTILRHIPDLVCIYLYGSQATETTNEQSDLDLAVLGGRPIKTEMLETVRLELLSLPGIEAVDLIDLLACPTTLAIEILQGKVLWETNALERARFETRTLSAYAVLNEERVDIVQDIRKRGSVYGR